MKIMFVIPTLGTGGAERVATILANNFSKEHDVEFFVMEKSDVERYPIDKKVRIKEFGVSVKRGNKIRTVSNYLLNFTRQRKALKKECDLYGADVVISFLPKADMLVASIVHNSCDFRWIPSERNDPMSRSKLERKILNAIYRKSDILICQTKKISRYYKSVGVKNTCVIKNPLILNSQNDLSFSINDRYIISVGRLDKQKNYAMLIEAFSSLKKRKQFKEKLYILGDGPEKENLQRLINESGMKDEVILTGRKNNVNDYLAHATAFVMSSDYEGMPNALLEAMAMGLPVISTDFFTGAARELINEKNGILVPVRDKKEMEIAIEKILSKTHSQLSQLGEISRKRVSKLDVETIVQEWTALISSLN